MADRAGPAREPPSPNAAPPTSTPVVRARAEVAVPRYDLRAGVPDLSAFPRRAWLATSRRVLRPLPTGSSITRTRAAFSS